MHQRFDYYPYGSVSRSWSSFSMDSPDKRYRFGGKEIAEEDYLDFGARLYSPDTAMWMSQDPMLEDYYPIGPFAYCAGNPVNLVDPEGNMLVIIYENNGKMDHFYFTGIETVIPDDDYVRSVIEAYKYNKENWQNAGNPGDSPAATLVENKDITRKKH